MNNKLILSPHDINNIREALSLLRSETENLARSVFHTSDDFLSRNYLLSSVKKFYDFLQMVSSENRSQLGSVQTEIILLTNEIEKE